MGGETLDVARLKSSYPKTSPYPVGKLIPDIYKNRIATFYSPGQYETRNLRAYVHPPI